MAASGASFAQSSVTISGNLDYALINVGGDSAANKGSTVATTTGTSSTSVLRFIAVEDLGGGMKATAQYNFDPRALSNDAGAIGRDELFLGLSGSFGNLRLGSPNSIGLGAFLATSPLGTGIGSGYAPNSTGTGMLPVLNTRYNRSVRYDSPSFNGLTLSLLNAPGNDQTYAATNLVANARNTTEVGATYVNGPLTVALMNISQAAQTNNLAAVGNANFVKTSTTVLAANYNFGATTVYGAYFDGELLASTTTATDVKGYRAAIKHSIGAIDLMASYQEGEGKVSGLKDKVSGLRADYNLSKTAAAYVGYENWNGTAANDTRTLTSIGLRKSF
ncbi:MAG: porin [Limnohabitans sp.]